MRRKVTRLSFVFAAIAVCSAVSVSSAEAQTTPRSAVPAKKPAASTGPKWDLEIFGGAAAPNHPASGTSALPPAGAAFTSTSGFQSRAESSWYFGDGTTLLGQAATVASGIGLTFPRMTSLDPILQSASATHKRAAAFGGRLHRRLNDRYGLEFTVASMSTGLRLTDAVAPAVESSRASFIPFWNAVIASGPFTSPSVTSVSTIDQGSTRRILATGALTINLMKAGRTAPYIVAGAGAIHDTGVRPSATIVGNYKFNIATSGISIAPGPINDTDTVKMHYETSGGFAMVIGAGVKRQIASRLAVHVDVRDMFGPNRTTTLVDATPSVAIGAPQAYIASNGSPSLQFSSSAAVRPGLGGAPVKDFKTFSGSGLQHVVNITGGLSIGF